MSRNAISRTTPLRLTAAGGLALTLLVGVLPLGSATTAVAAEPRATAFVEAPNTFYTLQRSLPANAAPTVSIERRTATDSGIANDAVTLGGIRTLPGVNGHSANALGVSSDGVFYFTTQRDAQTRAGGVSIWRYEVRGMPGTNRPAGTCPDGQLPSGSRNNGWACAPQRVVSDLSLNSGVNGGGTIVGGAVHPISGAFYFTYISGTPESASALNPTGPGNVRAHVYRYDPQRAITEGEADAGEVMHVDMRKHATFITDTPQSGGNLNGDIAFDGQGNLLITVSNPIAGAARGQMMLATVPYEDYRSFPTIRWTENAATVPTVEPRSMIGGLGQAARFNPIRTATSGLNGLAYTSSGQLIAQQGSVQAVASPTTFVSRGAPRTISSTGGQVPVDLASSRVPATITVLKNFEERIDDADQVRLSAALTVGSTVTPLESITTSGTDSGPQGAQIGPVPFEGKGTITMGEELVPSTNAALYSASYACYAMPPPYNTRGIVEPVRFLSGEGTSISLAYVQQMAAVAGITVGAQYDEVGNAETDGFAITCEFTNGALRPALTVAKSAVPESGTPLEAGETVHYRLTFDNSTGLAPATVDHVDHLADVLDDAAFVEGSVRYGDGTESAYPGRDQPFPQGVRAEMPDAAKQLAITGVVPAESVRTVWFSVVVRANDEPRAEETTTTAFQLLNVITRSGELPSAECVEGATTCTSHAVPAWTVTKTSNPLPGAWVNDGGSVYYALSVQKVAPVEFELAGVVLVDDMSEVMSVARMDEEAPDYGGSYRFDVRTFDASGAVVRSFADDPTNAWDDRPFDVSQLHPVHSGSSNPSDPTWRWTLELPPLTLAENEVRAEIMYVVRVGGAADPSQPSQFQLAGDTVLHPAVRLARFVNTVSADAAALAPVQCRTGEAPADACQVAHTVADHYFHIQKNSTSRDAEGNVVWNLTGAEFVIQDYAPAAGWPAGLPAAQLCRTNYAAAFDEASGTWSLGDPVGTYDPTALPDWAEHSATYDSLIAYNSYALLHGLPSVPLCALFYPLVDSSYGQAPGAWHARNLDEGAYELIETRAPDGHQLLAQPVAFVVGAAGQGHQLDLVDRSEPTAFLERCTNSARLPTNGAEACVMSEGWLLHVYDTQLQKLPLSGGWFTGQFTLLGSLIVLAGLIVAVVRLMRRGERPHNPLARRRSARRQEQPETMEGKPCR